ncbi:MAG TPA: cytochrome c3 family protein [Opitutaceae bacterium]|nr:cytochrome c3 family protein [Opitutaceae bacterium]
MNARALVIACLLAAIVAARAGVTSPTSSAVATDMAPLSGNQAVPAAWLPPGAQEPDNGPSSVIFPPQRITIRMNHKTHVRELGETCVNCHRTARSSRQANDDLLPSGEVCDRCHQPNHGDLRAVTGTTDVLARCALCHAGYDPGAPLRVAAFEMPKPNLRFDHKAHADRNIACGQCHGSIEELEVATRDQLPRMKGCFGCHAMTGAAQGGAKSACNTCHLTDAAGQMKVLFSTGELKPPRWLGNAQHTADFLERHRAVAADNSALCASCHSERYCADCHDGRVRPRTVHPNDWISIHPIASRQNNPRCTSCHHEQSFCLGCHQRIGVAMSGPNAALGKFHPANFATVNGRGAGHHAWEAQRNLSACVSCHTERDCAICHAASGRGGLSVDPHPPSFRASCAAQLRRNGRPCLVCHEPSSAELESCR